MDGGVRVYKKKVAEEFGSMKGQLWRRAGWMEELEL